MFWIKLLERKKWALTKRVVEIDSLLEKHYRKLAKQADELEKKIRENPFWQRR
jgi:hypothetical protein